ncbi:MAG: transposase, partial [SAR202 cluster bacterium Io17-Chloro-G4]
EVFYTLKEVQVLTEQYKQTYNRIRPHSSLGYRPPAPETVMAAEPVPEMAGLT